MRISEIKRHIDGSEERYTLTQIHRARHAVIAEYRFKRTYVRDGFTIPRGGKTYGFFWELRPYVMYRILDPEGGLVAHRFDVVEDVRLAERGVSYTDLLLDIWVRPDGTAQVEDEDEVEAARKDGVLSAEDVDQIDRVRDLILRRHRVIIRDAISLLP